MWPSAAAAAEPAKKEMAKAIAASLRESGELSNYRVGVKFEDGVAWLIGSVTSAEQSEIAERVTGTVDGVEHVVNELTIKETKAEAKEDGTSLKLMAAEQAEPNAMPPVPEAMPAPLSQPMARPMEPAPRQMMARSNMPRPIRQTSAMQAHHGMQAQYGYSQGAGMPAPQGYSTGGAAGVSYDQAQMPGYAWPSYAAHPNYSAVTYPQQYSASAWPYIGPFYPYPQVPLGWRKVTLEWDDGWWYLDFSHHKSR